MTPKEGIHTEGNFYPGGIGKGVGIKIRHHGHGGGKVTRVSLDTRGFNQMTIPKKDEAAYTESLRSKTRQSTQMRYGT